MKPHRSTVHHEGQQHGEAHAMARESATALWLRAIRCRQWIKNILVFLPIFFAHEWKNAALLARAITAFAAFSAGASAIYLVNDCLDLRADRLHPVRRWRPLAAGLLNARAAWIVSGVLCLLGLILACQLSAAFALVFCVYVLATVLYSVWLKKVIMLDVLMLAGFYTIRIFAGSVATGVPVSNWLLIFSMFFFLSLAFHKRTSELRAWHRDDEPLRRRNYLRMDLERLDAMGNSSGYLAVLVFALYLQSPDVTAHYAQPGMLWWICPCLLYWLSRLSLLAGRGRVSEDAISFAFRDKASCATGALVFIIILLARPV